MKPLIGYLRVSTKKQSKRKKNATKEDDVGLGLLAQQEAIQRYADSVKGTVVCEYPEIESGKNNDRKELAKALAHAKLIGATLVIAKLDRLARNVAFVSGLMESKVPFVCCDNPQANDLTIHILAAVAEAEAKFISRRTKEGLEQTRKLGTLLGGEDPRMRNLTPAARAKGQIRGGAAMKRKAKEFREEILPVAREIGGAPDVVAEELNRRGYRTRRGLAWNANSVRSILTL